jgi:hypothetical protein
MGVRMQSYVMQIFHLCLEIFFLWFIILGFCFLIGGKKWGEKWWRYSWGNLKAFGEFLFKKGVLFFGELGRLGGRFVVYLGKKILLLFGFLFEGIGKILSSWGR